MYLFIVYLHSWDHRETAQFSVLQIAVYLSWYSKQNLINGLNTSCAYILHTCNTSVNAIVSTTTEQPTAIDEIGNCPQTENH